MPFDRIAEARIREAIEQGVYENLPGCQLAYERTPRRGSMT
jgi:hypothetical protein